MKKNEVVVKSNKLVEASYRLTLIEKQLVLYSICSGRKNRDQPFNREVSIQISDFADMFSLNEKTAYAQVKKAVDDLYKRSITIGDNDTIRWIYRKHYPKKSGIVTMTFPDELVPYLSNLEKEFTSYHIGMISELSSVHSIRIYELLFQFVSIGERRLEVKWLKDRLGLLDKYDRWAEFKRRVVDVAVEQINSLTDIEISYDLEIVERAVVGLIFTIKEKKIKLRKVTKEEIEKLAHPGETYDQAEKRLMKVINAAA